MAVHFPGPEPVSLTGRGSMRDGRTSTRFEIETALHVPCDICLTCPCKLPPFERRRPGREVPVSPASRGSGGGVEPVSLTGRGSMRDGRTSTRFEFETALHVHRDICLT